MISQKAFYIEKIAEDARKVCEEKKIIKENLFQIDEIMAHKIINFFGGKIVEFDYNLDNEGELVEGNTYFKKINNNKFVIGYINYSAFEIMTELGKAFLVMDNMKDGEIKCKKDYSLDNYDAEHFSRAFLMPSYQFAKSSIEHSIYDQVQIMDVAKDFGIDYLEIIARGRELDMWQ